MLKQKIVTEMEPRGAALKAGFPMGNKSAQRKIDRKNPLLSTREIILAAALRIAAEHGYRSVNRKMIADHTGKVRGVVNHHFGNLEQLRVSIMEEAIRQKNIPVIMQMLAFKEPITDELKNADSPITPDVIFDYFGERHEA